MPGLVAGFFKVVGPYALKLFQLILPYVGNYILGKIAEWLQKYQTNKELKRQQEADRKAQAAKSEELVQDMKREEGTSDEDYQKQKEAAWDKFTGPNKP